MKNIYEIINLAEKLPQTAIYLLEEEEEKETFSRTALEKAYEKAFRRLRHTSEISNIMEDMIFYLYSGFQYQACFMSCYDKYVENLDFFLDYLPENDKKFLLPAVEMVDELYKKISESSHFNKIEFYNTFCNTLNYFKNRVFFE